MLQITHSPLLGFVADNLLLIAGGSFAALVLLILLISAHSEIGPVIAMPLGVIAYVLIVLPLAASVGFHTENVDHDKVYAAVESQTSLQHVQTGRDLDHLKQAIDGSPISDDSPTLVGYAGGVEVTFKVTLDNDTGKITDLVVVSPATSVTYDDLLHLDNS